MGYLETPEYERDESEWDDLMAMSEEEATAHMDREMARINAEYDAWRRSLTRLGEYRADRRSTLFAIMRYRRRLRNPKRTWVEDAMPELFADKWREFLGKRRVYLVRLRAELYMGCAGSA